MRGRDEEAVFVEASARLHFGVLDLRGTRGRWFGGIGASASTPTLLVSASRAETLAVEGEDALRATEFARQFLAHHRHCVRRLCCVCTVRCRHTPGWARARSSRWRWPGLWPNCTASIAMRASWHAPWAARGARPSAPGHSRAAGSSSKGAGVRIATSAVHSSRGFRFRRRWRCVVAVPDGAPGISGAEESEAFAQLPQPAERDVERVAHLVLMALLPALADADLDTFGRALSEIQEITGRWFAPAQGGTFAPGASRDLVHRLTEWGASGVGQSSWGPSVYGIVEGEEAGRRLADRVRAHLGASGSAFEGPFRSDGARVWRAAVVEV